MKKILFVLVNYNNDDEICHYCNHLNSKFNNEDIDIQITNNSEFSSKLERIKRDNISIVNIGKNVGYFTGLYRGIEQYKKNKILPEWIIIGNSDIEIVSNNIINIVDNYSGKIMCIAPRIISQLNNKNQNPFMVNMVSLRYLKLLRLIYNNIVFFTIFNFISSMKNKIVDNRTNKKCTTNIYAPHGSFIILNKNFFELGGTLQYKGFLYGEEVYLAEQIRRLNGGILYMDDIHIKHKEHSTTGKLLNKKKMKLKYDSINFLIEFLEGN